MLSYAEKEKKKRRDPIKELWLENILVDSGLVLYLGSSDIFDDVFPSI